MTRKLVVGLVFGLFPAIFASEGYSEVIVSSWNMGVIARDNTTGDTAAVYDGTVVLPFSATRTASTLGGTEGTVLYDFLVAGDDASFHFETDANRTGAIDSQVSTYADIFFQVTEDSSFDFDGLVTLEGAGRIALVARLRDLSISGGYDGFVYGSDQISRYTPNQVLHVGGMGGDDNTLIGVLPGALLPGHEYLMQFAFDIITPAGGDAGANAHGFLDFTVAAGSPPAPPNPVPEPTSLAMWAGLGIMGLIAARRRRRRAA